MSGNQVQVTGAALEPVGVEGCPTCAVLIESRQIAREVDELGAVAHCNRQISNHPHRRVTDWQRSGDSRVWGVL